MLAADRDDLAGQVRGVVAGEEDHDVGDLPRLGRAAERLPADQFRQEFLARHLGQEGVHGQPGSARLRYPAARPRSDADDHRARVDRLVQSVLRRDERLPVAAPSLIPLGEFVAPRLRLRHLPTLTAGPTARGSVRAGLAAVGRAGAAKLPAWSGVGVQVAPRTQIIPVQRDRFEIILEIAGLAVIVGGPANGLRWDATLLSPFSQARMTGRTATMKVLVCTAYRVLKGVTHERGHDRPAVDAYPGHGGRIRVVVGGAVRRHRDRGRDGGREP